MTTTQSGAPQQERAPTGTEAAQVAGGGSSVESTQVSPSFDWHQALGDDYARHERLLKAKGWKGLGDALASYSGLESMIGAERLALPGKDAPAEAWAQVWNRLGRPEAPEGYELSRPAEAEGYSEEMASKFRQAAHGAGLTGKQAAALHDWWLEELGQTLAGARESDQQAEGELSRKLEIAWGSTKEAKLAEARRAARHFGLEEVQLERLESVVGDWRLLEGLASIGALLGEDSLVGRRTATMTEEGAQAEIRRLQGDAAFRTAYLDRAHPGHGEAVRRMTELSERANPFAVARGSR